MADAATETEEGTATNSEALFKIFTDLPGDARKCLFNPEDPLAVPGWLWWYGLARMSDVEDCDEAWHCEGVGLSGMALSMLLGVDGGMPHWDKMVFLPVDPTVILNVACVFLKEAGWIEPTWSIDPCGAHVRATDVGACFYKSNHMISCTLYKGSRSNAICVFRDAWAELEKSLHIKAKEQRDGP